MVSYKISSKFNIFIDFFEFSYILIENFDETSCIFIFFLTKFYVLVKTLMNLKYIYIKYIRNFIFMFEKNCINSIQFNIKFRRYIC